MIFFIMKMEVNFQEHFLFFQPDCELMCRPYGDFTKKLLQINDLLNK